MEKLRLERTGSPTAFQTQNNFAKIHAFLNKLVKDDICIIESYPGIGTHYLVSMFYTKRLKRKRFSYLWHKIQRMLTLMISKKRLFRKIPFLWIFRQSTMRNRQTSLQPFLRRADLRKLYSSIDCTSKDEGIYSMKIPALAVSEIKKMKTIDTKRFDSEHNQWLESVTQLNKKQREKLSLMDYKKLLYETLKRENILC